MPSWIGVCSGSNRVLACIESKSSRTVGFFVDDLTGGGTLRLNWASFCQSSKQIPPLCNMASWKPVSLKPPKKDFNHRDQWHGGDAWEEGWDASDGWYWSMEMELKNLRWQVMTLAEEVARLRAQVAAQSCQHQSSQPASTRRRPAQQEGSVVEGNAGDEPSYRFKKRRACARAGCPHAAQPFTHMKENGESIHFCCGLCQQAYEGLITFERHSSKCTSWDQSGGSESPA